MKRTCFIALLSLILGFGAGFLFNSSLNKQKQTVEFVRLSPVRINPTIPEPEIIQNENPVLPAEATIPNAERQKLLEQINQLENSKKRDSHLIDSLRHALAKVPERVADSTALYRDYTAIRKYTDWPIFDIDTIGQFKASIDVQFNRIKQVYDAEFHPVQRVVRNKRKEALTPYLSASYSTLGYTGFGGGVFFQTFGIEYQYQTNFSANKQGHSFALKYRF